MPEAKTFDLAGWLTGASLPQRSATVYQRADLLGELSDLERQIKNQVELVGEQEALDSNNSLVKAYRKAAAEFEKSGLTVFIQAVTPENQRLIADRLGDDASKEDVGAHTMAAAIIAVQPHGGEREPITFTADDVKSFTQTVGQSQSALLYSAWHQACNEIPAVDADFLQKLSSRAAGKG